LLRESALNPRRHYNEQALDELAASIREQGVLTPPLVRPIDGGFEIAAGHRRFRAAQRAGLVEIPVIIRQMTDQQFLEVMTIENLQREDIHPIEEAEGYQRLIERYGYTPESLAERVGRSGSYVAKRLALSRLIDSVKEAFLEDRLQLGHALLLARLHAGDQELAVKDVLWGRGEQWVDGKWVKIVAPACAVRELDSWIRDNVYLNLSSAAWRRDDATLLAGAGPCTTCTKRTGANGLLFDDVDKGDMCLDAECFHQKRDNHLLQVQKLAEEKGAPLIRIALEYHPDAKNKNVLTSGAYHLVSKKADRCEHLEKAVIAAGSREVGKVVDVCRTKGCKKHGVFIYHTGTDGGGSKSFGEIWKDKRAKLDEKIALELKRDLWRQVVHDVPEEFNRPEMELVGRKLIQRAGHDGRQALCGVLLLPGEKHKEYAGYDFEKPLIAHMEALAEKDLPGFLVGAALYGSLCFNEKDLIAAAELYEIDVKAIEAAIAGPLQAEFEKKKAKAAANDAAKKKAEKKAAKAAAPKKEAKAAGERAAKKAAKPKKAAKAVPVPIAEEAGGDE
jgi:ParB family chromosome partitioning protein